MLLSLEIKTIGVFMKMILILTSTLSISAFAKLPTVDQIFKNYDKNQDNVLTFKEHKIFYKDHGSELERCLQTKPEIPTSMNLRFQAYLYLTQQNPAHNSTLKHAFNILFKNYRKIQSNRNEMQVLLDRTATLPNCI